MNGRGPTWLRSIATKPMVALVVLIVGLVVGSSLTASNSYTAHVAVHFSPHGGCTDAIVRELAAAQKQILLQAYSFTSAPIAKALVDAHKRGVEVKAILDKSNETAQYSSATFLANAGIPVLIDSEHAIAHNKILVLDGSTVITGSFNFTKAAEAKNAENLLVLKDAPELVKAYEQNINAHAAHSHPYHRTEAGREQGKGRGQAAWSPQETAAGQEAQGSGVGEAEIRGNKRSHVYHLPGCPAYDHLSPQNIIAFKSEEEARKAGYRKAKNCP